MRTENNFIRHRAVVTDTTPYEVPVIFTNDRFYNLISSNHTDQELKTAIDKILDCRQIGKLSINYYIPYNYAIKKDSVRTTTLSIPHPLWQKEVSVFISAYEETILTLCSKSSFSLRKPTAVASLYTDNNLDFEKALKTGVTHSSEDEDETAASKIISYFKYGKYTLLAKFYESSEFINLERRYKYTRHLDVSKCFYHIYTHSVTWASKGKTFAKDNVSSYSFENKFDKLMQKSNYNETNGIIVGPEISRIFAEIILQNVDTNCEETLKEKHNLIFNKNYVIRRYVDDFAVFANLESDLFTIEKVIRDELEKYKLYINEKKLATSSRPFITPLSIAKKELRSIINSLHGTIDEIANLKTNPQIISAKHRILKGITSDIRAIVKRNGIEFSAISGWLLSSIRNIIGHSSKVLADPISDQKFELWFDIVNPLMDVSFHVCALDLRVRTTYSLCQLISAIKLEEVKLSKKNFDTIELIIQEFLIEIICNAVSNDSSDRINDVDIQNLLITGAFFFKSSFTENLDIIAILKKLIHHQSPRYFNIITLKFCIIQNKLLDTELMKELHKDLHDYLYNFLMSSAVDLKQSEHYMIMCEYLGFSDINQNQQRNVFKKLFGGEISSVALTQLTSFSGFVDWNNLNIEHLLKRKQLRPVYAIA